MSSFYTGQFLLLAIALLFVIVPVCLALLKAKPAASAQVLLVQDKKNKGCSLLVLLMACLILVTLSFLSYQYLGASDQVVLREELRAMPKQTHKQQLAVLNRMKEVLLKSHSAESRQLFILGVSYLNLEDYRQAQEVLLRLYESRRNDPEVLAQLAKAYYLQDEVIQSQKFVKRALDIEPNNDLALTLKAYTAFSAGNYQQAINAWQQLIALQPKNTSLYQHAIDRAKSQLAANSKTKKP